MHPYTKPFSTVGLSADAFLDALREDGWTIEPPKPRFYVDEVSDTRVYVRDRTKAPNVFRTYHVDPDIEPYDDTVAVARAEADRLNHGGGA